MREQLLTALRAYYTGQISRHKANIENMITNNVGVADHPDYIETISKEMEEVAKYDDMLMMINKHFKG